MTIKVVGIFAAEVSFNDMHSFLLQSSKKTRASEAAKIFWRTPKDVRELGFVYPVSYNDESVGELAGNRDCQSEGEDQRPQQSNLSRPTVFH